MTVTVDFDIIEELGLDREQVAILSVAGSHMYGLDTPDSDSDFLGIYLPTRKQLLTNDFPNHMKLPKSMGIDCQMWSLHYFLKLACQGETMAIDLLHSPIYCWVEYNPIWFDLMDCRYKFYTRNMDAFCSYARKQAARYGLKGERMETLENVIAFLKTCGQNAKLLNVWDALPEYEHTHFLEGQQYRMYQVCGQRFLETVKVSYIRDHLEKELTKYGERAKLARENKGVDWKAVSHALRTIEQVHDILKYGDYAYPLKNSKFIKEVKQGKLDFINDVQLVLEENIAEVERLAEYSDLPEETDKEYWDNWLIYQMERYVL